MRRRSVQVFVLLLLGLGSFLARAENSRVDCDGDFFVEYGAKVCLGKPLADWVALAARDRPSAKLLTEIEQRLRTTGADGLLVERPFREYGFVLLHRSGGTGVPDPLGVLGADSQRIAPFERINVYRRDRSLMALVNSFTVGFDSKLDQRSVSSLLNSYGAKVKEGLQDELVEPGVYLISFPGITAAEALGRSNRLQQEKGVSFSEPNFEVFMPAPGMPRQPPTTASTDPLYEYQWYLQNRGEMNGKPFGKKGADINAAGAWSQTMGKQSIVIAILDVGVETTHPDLKDHIVSPYDAVDKDNDQRPQKNAAHGTECSGIAAAIANNGLGIKGIAAEVRIMPVRMATVVISNSEDGPNTYWNTSARVIARGIRTAVKNGAKVLSGSWFWPGPTTLINKAIDFALEENRVLVFAVGQFDLDVEEATSEDSVDYPARLAQGRPVIAVTATNQCDEFKSGEQRDCDGVTRWGSHYGPAVTVAAPGVQMITTDLIADRGDNETGDYYPDFDGTSAATPLVAGVAALILSVEPGLTPAQVKERLESTAKDLGSPDWDSKFGSGRIDACRAVRGIPREMASAECDVIEDSPRQ
jgi:subtilisin family serine protease